MRPGGVSALPLPDAHALLLRRAARGDAALRGHGAEPERGILSAVRPSGQHDAGLAGGRCGERAAGLGAALHALGGSENDGPGGGVETTDYRYTGQRADSYINLYWYNSRWYDPGWDVLFRRIQLFRTRIVHLTGIVINMFEQILSDIRIVAATALMA